MPLLREVEAYPATGFPDRRWDADGDKAAFLARSRGIFELYCLGLPAAKVPARRSMVRFFLDEDKPARFHVRLLPGLEAFESANIAVPDGFATWAEEDQLRACLEVIHQGLLGLGRARGWPLAPLEALRDQVAEQGLRLWWASAWKLSPNRRHKARGVYRIAPDGYGRVQLEVWAATGRDEVLARSEPQVAFGTLQGLARSAATLRWDGSDRVSLVPWSGLFGQSSGGLQVDLTVGEPIAPLRIDTPVGPGAPVPVVVEDAAPPVRAGSGWLIADRLDAFGAGAYEQEVARVVDLLARDAEHAAWWAGSPFGVLYLQVVVEHPRVHYAAARAGVRKRGQDQQVTVVRTLGEMPARTEGDVLRGLARADVHQALVDVAAKRRLPPPPPLPDRIANSRHGTTGP